MLIPSRVPSGRHEFVVRMYREDYLGGQAEYVYPLTISNPDFGKPLNDPAYAQLRGKFKKAQFASIRSGATVAEVIPAFPSERVIATRFADAVIKPNNRDWDPRKNNFGTEKQNKFGRTPHDKDMSALFLRLDLAGLKGTRVKGAVLRLTMTANWGKAPIDWEVFAVRRAWTESGVCFYGPEGRKGPAWGKEGARDTTTDIFPEAVATFQTVAFPAAGEKRRLVTIDLSTIVSDWLSGAKPNHGILIRPTAAVPGGRDISVCSREFEDYPFRPTLVIAYDGNSPFSAVKGAAPAFPTADSAPAPRTVSTVKTIPAPEIKSKKAAAKPAKKGSSLPPGFCWLMPMEGKKFPAKILKYEGELVHYETPEGKKLQANRSEVAIICP
ncbi:DNRLRE domain-containing protein [Planctomycetota bacterium]